jgi:epoxyqueuosine reductase
MTQDANNDINRDINSPEAPILARDGDLTSSGEAFRETLRAWAQELGFQALGIAAIDLSRHEAYLQKWLAAGYHGDMHYMARHGTKRSRPNDLVPGTCSVLTLRMDYLPEAKGSEQILATPEKAFISRYALGRDYHKLMRQRLAKLAERIEAELGGGQYRAFVDSAPVLERALAEQGGLGWIGKNTMLINERAGSYFFLGEIYTDVPLSPDPPKQTSHCGTCTACMPACPTNAFVAPYQLDARRCISYLTIEHSGSIDPELRPLMGNRIYGCDDCQLVCPWNKFAETTSEPDFSPRQGLDDISLVELFGWSQEDFDARTLGSPIRRIGYERWLRNIAVALGNAPTSADVIAALTARADHPSALVREHVQWALARHLGTGLANVDEMTVE